MLPPALAYRPKYSDLKDNGFETRFIQVGKKLPDTKSQYPSRISSWSLHTWGSRLLREPLPLPESAQSESKWFWLWHSFRMCVCKPSKGKNLLQLSPKKKVSACSSHREDLCYCHRLNSTHDHGDGSTPSGSASPWLGRVEWFSWLWWWSRVSVQWFWIGRDRSLAMTASNGFPAKKAISLSVSSGKPWPQLLAKRHPLCSFFLGLNGRVQAPSYLHQPSVLLPLQLQLL